MASFSAATPEQPFPTYKLKGSRPLHNVFEPFVEAVVSEATDAPVAPWSDKSGFSMFDEEEVLGTMVLKLPQPAPAGSDVESLNVAAESAAEAGAGEEMASMCFESNAVRVIRRSCCLYTVEHDSDVECPICLEKLLRGQMAWRLPCLHQVHRNCAEAYFGSRRRVKPCCPVCRFDVRVGGSRAQQAAAEPTTSTAA